MSNHSRADDYRTLLQTVEADTTRTSPNRDELRGAVLTAFDEASVDGSQAEQNYVEIVPLMQPRNGRRITQTRALGLMAVAAALLLLALGTSANRWRVETTGPADKRDSEPRLITDQTEIPAPLRSGKQSTANIADGFSFDAPEGLIVIAEDEGHLHLAADLGLNAGRLIIAETDLDDWQARMVALAEDGQVKIKRVGVMVSGRATTRLDVTVTNTAIASLQCEVNQPCIRIQSWPSSGPLALWAGADNRIVEIGRTDEVVVLALEVTRRSADPLSPLAAHVVSTSTLS